MDPCKLRLGRQLSAVIIAAALAASGAVLAQSGASSGSSGNSASGTKPGSSAMGMGGVTPGRAEQSSSAFAKLDAQNRGYVTMEDARQLDGFDAQFKLADRNGDGRLDASEFNSAWSAYGRSAR